MPTPVPTYVCPPDIFSRASGGGERSNKRRADDGLRKNESQRIAGDQGGGLSKMQRREETGARTEISEIMDSIREFSSSTLRGQSKLKHKDDKLVKLGAAPKKQQTMPFKMAMGIKTGREKRSSKAIERAKESGRVLAKPSRGSGGKDDDEGAKRPRRDDASMDFNIHAKKGVFHLDKKRLPQALVEKGFSSHRGGRDGGRGRGGRGGGGRGGGGRGGGGRGSGGRGAGSRR